MYLSEQHECRSQEAIVPQPVRFSSLCCHCHDVIPFEVSYQHCELCKLDICQKCHESETHSQSHNEHLSSLVAGVIVDRLADSVSNNSCSRCNESFQAGYSCRSCPENICSKCKWQSPEHSLRTHQHRDFLLWKSPYSGLTPKARISAARPCSHDTGIKGHCQGCLASLFHLSPRYGTKLTQTSDRL